MSRHPRPQPLTRRPTVTVVIPCYNYGHYLPSALASVLGQPDVDVDVIVIDDASPDGSGDVVRDIARGDDRIRAICHERNRGHIATYNEGLELATGEYVALMSADDALPHSALARATALLDAEPSVGFVYGFPIHFDGALPPAPDRVRSWTVWSGEEWIERLARRGHNCIASPEVVLRTSVQHAIGGYDAKLPFSGDLEMWLRAAANADVGRVNGPAQAYYRVHTESMQRTVYTGRMNELEGRLDAFEKVLTGAQARLRRSDELLERAKRGLASTALEYSWSAYGEGRGSLEPVDEYLAFATRIWPGVEHTRAWRLLQRRAKPGGERLDRGVAAKARRLSEDLTARLRWRRWRWSGI